VMLHAPATHVLFLMGAPVVTCMVDYLYSFFGKTHLIQSTEFRRLGSASVLSFENPPGFELNGAAYVYVMLPWLHKTEWHAFSVFPDPEPKNGKPTSSICAAVTGAPDSWTRELHATLTRPTRRAAWVCGPFLSPYSTAINYDNIVAVASGIGITPALSLLNLYKASRRVNLIWICRDNTLIEHFLARETFDDDAFTLIYYTGDVALSLAVTKDLPPNVSVFKGRPNLESVVTGIIHSIEGGKALPENIVAEGEFLAASTPEERARHAIFKMMKVHSDSEIYNAVIHRARTSARETTHRSRRVSTSRKSLAASTVAPISRIPASFSGKPINSQLEPALSRAMSAVRTKQDWNLLDDSLPGPGETGWLAHFLFVPTLADLEHALLDLVGDSTVTAVPPSIAHIYDTVVDWGDEKEFSKSMHNLRTLLVGGSQAGASSPKASALTVMERFDGVGGKAPVQSKPLGDPEGKTAWGLPRLTGAKILPSLDCMPRFSSLQRLHDENNSGGEPLRLTSLATLGKEYVAGTGNEARDRWEMLYCGGSAPMVESLKDIESKYGISLAIERFDW
jgi:hypothetical protein